MSKLSGNKDTDREILLLLNDKELLKACSIDKYTWNKVCDDEFLKRRLLSKYPKIDKYKRVDESWKQFFLRAIYHIALLKEDYNFIYRFGDFMKQYKDFVLIFETNKYRTISSLADKLFRIKEGYYLDVSHIYIDGSGVLLLRSPPGNKSKKKIIPGTRLVSDNSKGVEFAAVNLNDETLIEKWEILNSK
jgi:hypothetical protein